MALAPQEPPRAGPAQMWVPRGYATSAADGPGAASASTSTSAAVAAEQGGAASQKLSSLFKAAPNFEVDNSTFTEAQIRATFYPKFENEKSDQEVSAWGARCCCCCCCSICHSLYRVMRTCD